MESLTCYQLKSGIQSGVYNMALDDAILEYLRTQVNEPMLVVRTYEWDVPTLSLGVHQPAKDIKALKRLYGDKLKAVVYRPTGGRAILHGEDISFSFITNAPQLTQQSLKDCYCELTKLVKTAFNTLEIDLLEECLDDSDSAVDTKAYTRSPVCFETRIPSDIMAFDGQKICGSAQARRAGGVLQHGAAFLKGFSIEPDAFSEALFDAVKTYYNQDTLAAFDFQPLQPLFDEKLNQYKESASRIWSSDNDDMDSTSMGSHFEPASS